MEQTRKVQLRANYSGGLSSCYKRGKTEEKLLSADDQEPQDKIEKKTRLFQLQIEHEDLGAAIEALVVTGGDPLRIQRLKKKKLELKDEIAKLQDETTPDIIA